MQIPYKNFFSLISILFFIYTPCDAAQSINIGIVIDGPIKRELLQLERMQQEIQYLNSNEFQIHFPPGKLLNGNWQIADIRTAIKTLLADDEVDLIITNGLLASHEAAKITPLSKPVIAPIVADRILQELPYKEGKSGKHNYVYISDNRTVAQDLHTFRKLTELQHLAVLVDKLFVTALPRLRNIIADAEKELGMRMIILPVTETPSFGLAQLPADIDAIYVAPLLRFSRESLQQLADELIKRRLPSFSLLGREELELGLMATLGGRAVDNTRYARRIALYVQSILLGADPAELDVYLDQTPKLAINMRTARAINFSPKWQDMETAELLYNDADDDATTIGLVESMQRAIGENLSLRTAEINKILAIDDTNSARSALLPQADFSLGISQIDRQRTNGVAQNSTDADIGISQLIYSENVWSNLDIAKLLQQSEDNIYKTNILDVLQNSATAYLRILLAQAGRQIRESNLKVTEENLELAMSRQRIGVSDRAEVLRWESQLATDRQNLYATEADWKQAKTELKRQLSLPLDQAITVTDAGIQNLLDILSGERFNRFFDNQASFKIFTQFAIEHSLKNAPELSHINAIVESNKRRLKAAKRSYYIPDISINGNYGYNIDRAGKGASNPALGDEQWSLGVRATLPLFAGNARKATISRTNNLLIQSRYQRLNVREQVEARIRSALQKASGSHPAIRLSKEAMIAAQKNLNLVTDAYSKGLISVTDLIDAQDAALTAELSAVEAKYLFMIDWIEIQRATANFGLLLKKDGLEEWYQRLDIYYHNAQRENPPTLNRRELK